ncbi:MAG: hypothetical protein ACM3N4_05785 [Nitrososphaerota archaeon]
MENRDDTRDTRRDLLPASGASDEHTGVDEVASRQPDPTGDIALIGLGLLLEGSNLVTRQVGLSHVSDISSPESDASSARGALARRALIGFVAESRAQARARQDVARKARKRFVDRIASRAAPLTHWFPVDVTLAFADILTGYGRWKVESFVERLAEHGRVEEERARALAQQAFEGLVDEALAYFARNPAVRELVMQQGEEVAAGALDDLRLRSQSVDSWLAQATHRFFQRATQTRAPAATEPATAPAPTTSDSGT